MKTRIQIVFLNLLFCLLLLACDPAFNSLNFLRLNIPKVVLDVPAKSYGDILRFPNGNVIIVTGKETHFYHLNENQVLEISTFPDERCRRKTEYGLPTALPDGRLGFRMLCRGRWPDQPIGKDGASYIVAYDWNTETFEQIVDAPLPYSASGFTWAPDMMRGVQATGSLLGTIYWITPQGLEPITLTLSDGEKSWALDDNLAAMGDSDQIDVGIAASPAWSPDGRGIAFLASLDAIGREGIARARAKYKLYLLDPETLQTRVILEDITNTRTARSLTWSPDSQWIVISGRINSINGLWLISVNDRELQLVDTSGNGRFDGEAWLDNQTIIVARCINTDWPCPQSEIIRYDVSQIVQ